MRSLIALLLLSALIASCSPKAPAAKGAPTSVYIVVGKDGTITMNGKPTTLEGITSGLKAPVERHRAANDKNGGVQ